MPYAKTTFVNGSPPAVSAEELNKMGQGIEDVHNALIFSKDMYPNPPLNIKYAGHTPGEIVIHPTKRELVVIYGRGSTSNDLYRFTLDGDYIGNVSSTNYKVGLAYNPVDAYFYFTREYQGSTYTYRYKYDSNWVYITGESRSTSGLTGGIRHYLTHWSDTLFYAVDELKNLYTFSWAAGETLVTTLSFLPSAPISITKDSTHLYILASNTIYKVTTAGVLVKTTKVDPLFVNNIQAIEFFEGKMYAIGGSAVYFFTISDF